MRLRNTDLGDVHGWVSEEEKLVDTGDQDSPHDADNPSSESRRRHGRVVGVGHGGPDFWIRRLIFQCNGRWVKVGVVRIAGKALWLCRVGKLYEEIKID